MLNDDVELGTRLKLARCNLDFILNLNARNQRTTTM